MKQVLIEALMAAGKIQRKHYQSDHQISIKENFTSIVTEADKESEKEIIRVIEKHYPGHNILSEESGYTGKNSEFTWIIDPVDGTSNYAAGIPWFGPLIALIENNRPILAGAYLPVSGDMFLAEAGKGATRNGHSLEIKDRDLKDALSGFSTNYSEDEDYQRLALGIYHFLVQNTRNVRTTNALVDLMNVATGSYGGCVIMFNGLWDIVAPYLIIREAGGIMKNLDSLEIDFTAGREALLRNYPVVTGSGLFVTKVLEEITRLTP